MEFTVYLIVALLFAWLGAVMAESRNRSQPVWFVVCFLFGIFGVITLALAGYRPIRNLNA